MDTPADRIVVTRTAIARGLRELGLRAGDVALVHSSLSSMGYVEDGASTVIEAFLEVLDPAQGTLVLPTLCQKDVGRRFETWDIARSPSDVGAITEAGRLRPDAVRSDHATHSVAAIGRQATEVTAGHATAHGRPSPWGLAAFGFGSPWQWLYDHDAHYLFLGVTTSCNTIGHFAQAEFMRRVVAAAGDARAELEAQIQGWQEPGVWPAFGFAICEEWLQAQGAMQYATIGDATLRATRAQVNVETTIEHLEGEPEAFLKPEFVEWLDRARAASA